MMVNIDSPRRLIKQKARRPELKSIVAGFDPGWLVDARYDLGRATLSFVSIKTLQPYEWSDTSFRNRAGSN